MNQSADGRWPARLRRFVTGETSGGILLLGAAAIGFGWANSPASDAFTALAEHRIGPALLHLDLSLATWAAAGSRSTSGSSLLSTSALNGKSRCTSSSMKARAS